MGSLYQAQCRGLHCIYAFVASIGLLAFQHEAGATEVGWKQVKQGDGVTVFSRPYAGARFSEFKSVALVDADPQQCAEFVMSAETMPKWVYGAKAVRVVSSSSTGLERELYMQMQLPFPLRDRDVYARNRLEKKPDLSLVYSIELIPDRPREENFVRLERLQLQLTMTPVIPNKTRMEYVALIDPGGVIPSWADSLFSDAPFISLKNAQRMIHQAKVEPALPTVEKGL